MIRRFVFAALCLFGFASVVMAAPFTRDVPDFTVAYELHDPGGMPAAIVPDVPSVAVSAGNYGASEYISFNQPGQRWRVTVEAYKHIDPGRLMI